MERPDTIASATLRAVLALIVLVTGSSSCRPYDPTPNDEAFLPCCDGLGTCVPEGLLPMETRAQLGVDACQPQLLCVPKELAEDGAHVARSCKALGNAEGRCLPSCLPGVARADQLQRDMCAELELCVPCFDPRTGDETGACRLGGDSGPEEPPYVFGRCCEGEGRCVPGTVVEQVGQGIDLSQLGGRDCREPETLCISEQWLDTGAPKLSPCRSFLDFEGRCVPRCITKSDYESRLPRDTCAASELCAPCYDPRTDADTGACRQSGDQPTEPKKSFEACCSSNGSRAPQGRCVPRSFVETVAQPGDAQQLGQDSCAASDALCVPSNWLEDPEAKPTPCRAVGDFEGRCVPACLPRVAEFQDRLTQSACDDGSLCVPCYDPLSGVESGVCRQRDDAPKQPPSTFAACCGAGPGMSAIARCIPRALASRMAGAKPADVERLGPDSCPDRDTLCVPSAWLEQAQPMLTSCAALGQFEGRCLPSCLPEVQERRSQLTRDSCAASEMCAPCYDPFSGEATGACSIAGDRPLLPAQTFEACCRSAADQSHGRCVTRSVLESSVSGAAGQDLERLGVDTCSASDVLCVPNVWLDQADSAPASCMALGSMEGRCLPACLPDVQAQASRLQGGGCSNGDLCVPCYDPVSGEDSGACRIGSDRPTSGAQTFQACCGTGEDARGRCLPRDIVEASANGADLGVFGRDSCTSTDALCMPDQLAGDPEASPMHCRAPGDLEGRCLPDCLSGIQAERLSQGSCQERQLCAPCYDPLSGQATGVCGIAGDEPLEPPGEFETCCGQDGGAKGTCIPIELLSGSQQSLAVDSCSRYIARCVPTTQVATPDQPFPSCTSGLGSRGVCIGACHLGSSADSLNSNGCASDERCAPCSLVPMGVPGC